MEFEKFWDCKYLGEKCTVRFDFLGTKTAEKSVMEDLTYKYLWLREEFCASMQWMKRRWKIWSKNMIKSELNLKLVLNSILTKSQKILCFVWGMHSPEGSPHQRKWNKDEQRASQKPGPELLRDKSMLYRIVVCFCLCPYTENIAASFGFP